MTPLRGTRYVERPLAVVTPLPRKRPLPDGAPVHVLYRLTPRLRAARLAASLCLAAALGIAILAWVRS